MNFVTFSAKFRTLAIDYINLFFARTIISHGLSVLAPIILADGPTFSVTGKLRSASHKTLLDTC